MAGAEWAEGLSPIGPASNAWPTGVFVGGADKGADLPPNLRGYPGFVGCISEVGDGVNGWVLWIELIKFEGLGE